MLFKNVLNNLIIKHVALENLLMKAANDEDFQKSTHVPERLKLHLKIFTEDYVKLRKADLQSMLAHLQNFMVTQKKLISELITLVNLILVLPTTYDTSEGSFSRLRLIKIAQYL